MLRAYDIILIREAWASADDKIELQNLTYYNYPRIINTRLRNEIQGLGHFSAQ